MEVQFHDLVDIKNSSSLDKAALICMFESLTKDEFRTETLVSEPIFFSHLQRSYLSWPLLDQVVGRFYDKKTRQDLPLATFVRTITYFKARSSS